MDQSNPLSNSILLREHKQVTTQSKQEFFSIKKTVKRMKVSNQIYGQIQPKKLFQSQDINQFRIIKTIENLNVKQLHYSLAETQDPDVILQFKNKPLKKKKLPSKIFDQKLFKTPSQKKQLIQKIPTFLKNQTPNSKKQDQLKNFLIVRNKQSQQKKQRIIPVKNQKLQQKLTIEDFSVLKQIGEGAYSKVYKVIHKQTGFICALKILQKQLMRQLNVEENAIRQIKILMCLQHQNISSLYGSFFDQQFIYLVLQLCTDGDINSRLKQIKEKNKLKPQEYHKYIVNIIKQTAQAIKQLHSNNIIHRDIKPQNVLVTLGKNIKLSDFGWAVYSQKNILRKTLCGTPLYLAPQLIQTCLYTESVDIWAFGVLCYELLTNQYPFVIKKVNDLVKIVQDEIDFQKISDIHARDFVTKALRKKSSERAKIQQLCNHAFLRQIDQND